MSSRAWLGSVWSWRLVLYGLVAVWLLLAGFVGCVTWFALEGVFAAFVDHYIAWDGFLAQNATLVVIVVSVGVSLAWVAAMWLRRRGSGRVVRWAPLIVFPVVVWVAPLLGVWLAEQFGWVTYREPGSGDVSGLGGLFAMIVTPFGLAGAAVCGTVYARIRDMYRRDPRTRWSADAP